MSEIKDLTKKITEFRDARDWKQFHTPKDMVISLMLEAAELAEHFQWKSPQEIKDHLEKSKEQIGEELADVLYWVLLLSHDLGIDIMEASEKKLRKNMEKYPVDKSKGSNKKYTEL